MPCIQKGLATTADKIRALAHADLVRLIEPSPFRRAMPGWGGPGAIWTAALLLSASVWPLAQIREEVDLRREADADGTSPASPGFCQ